MKLAQRGTDLASPYRAATLHVPKPGPLHGQSQHCPAAFHNGFACDIMWPIIYMIPRQLFLTRVHSTCIKSSSGRTSTDGSGHLDAKL